MKEKLKKYSFYLLPMLLTVVIILITYIIKGVYPFGSSDISYYDMDAAYISIYSRNYEIMHGNDSFLFDWLCGCGMDMTSIFEEYTLHPINWITFFVPPEHMIGFMGLFLLIKLLIASFSISLYIKKMYDLPLAMHTALGIMYTFSGYVLEYYTNIFFLDWMMVLPFMILTLRHMHKTGKQLPYMLLLTFQLLTWAYFGALTLIFILLYSFGLMFLLDEKRQRKVFAARLGLSTFTSIAVACVTMIPTVLKWMKISRTDIYSNYYFLGALQQWMSDHLSEKLFLSFNTELAAAFAVVAVGHSLIKRKRMSKELVFRLYVYLITLFPLLNEATTLFWHLGSYSHFPYRVGYILVFASVELIAYLHTHEDEMPHIVAENKYARIAAGAAAVGLYAVSLILLIGLGMNFYDIGLPGKNDSFGNDMTIYIFETLLFIIVIFIASKKVREMISLAIITVQAALMSVCFIAPPESNVKYELTSKKINEAFELAKSIDIPNDDLSRIKTLYVRFPNNYSQFIDIPSKDQWMSEASTEYVNEVLRLGYGLYFTANYDAGGTLFSDALLNDKYVIVYGDDYVPEQIYSLRGKYEDYALYDMDFTLPFGLLTDERILNTDKEKMNICEHQIQVADIFADPDKPLFTLLTAADGEEILPETDETNAVTKYDILPISSCVVYMASSSGFEINVNGTEKEVINNHEEELVLEGLNGLVLIGAFNAGEETVIEVEGNPDNYQLLVLDLDAMKSLTEKYKDRCASSYKAGKNSLDITAEVNGYNYMFLPLEYLDGWSATVNGQPAKVHPVLNGAFMALELPDGHCDIKMRFFPPSIMKGAAVAAVGLAVSVLMLVMKKRGKDIAETKIVSGAAYIIFSAVSVGVIVLMYILPVIF